MTNPDVKASDEFNTQITIAEDDKSHDQTLPPAATSDAVTPSEIFWCAFSGEWSKMECIFKNDRNSVRIPLTAYGDTALHVAADAGNTTFVEELTKLMSRKDLLIPNTYGMLPVHLAALSGHRIIVQNFFYQQNLLEEMDYEDIEKLFFITIVNDMFDVAMEIFEKHPSKLSTARDEQSLTALHMLARKPSEVLRMRLENDNDTKGLIVTALCMKLVVRETITGMDLLREIWEEVRELRMEKILELTTRPSIVLFDAIESENNDEVILTFMESDGKLTSLKDRNGRNLLHLLFLYRRLEIFDKIKPSEKRQMIREVDKKGNNVLHLASQLPPEFRSFSGLRASKQMLSEVKWFKKVKEIVPHGLTRMRNKKGKRPVDVFYDEHKQLSEEIKGAAKVTAKSGMLVATLVATVAFAAALTVPGDKTNDWFIVFILANTVALFTSSASILSFLSNFTSSRFSESDFVTLHPGLIVGPPLLITSVVSMVMAFTAASFLIFDCKTKWVSYVVASMWVLLLFFFILFQFSILDSIFLRRHGLSKLVDARCLQRIV